MGPQTSRSTAAAGSGQRLDPTAMNELEKHIRRNVPSTRAVLVSVDGKVVYEKYFADGSPDERVNMFSCTKSVVSMLVGMMVKDGTFPGLDEPVASVLPSLAKSADASFRKLTVRNCLNMTLGYDLHFGDFDVLDTIRSRAAPGKEFQYNDVGPQIVSRIISERTGKTASALANATLFEALRIRSPPWFAAPDGFTVGGYGLQLTPQEMLRFGQFALQRGAWEGRQWVDPTFFDQSVEAQTAGGFPGNNGYGFLWWVSQRGGHRTFYALGYGGQLICVCPDLRLVAVIACTDELGPSVQPVQDLYFDHIVRAPR